jgi:methylated-DNA-[protein]-cysteine S-methyltransferase
MPSILIRYFPTSYGELILGSFGDRLCLCDWRYRRMRNAVDARIQRGLGATYVEGSTGVIEMAKGQLNEYFAGIRTVFNVPLRQVGTDFQQRVWDALCSIPFGATETYASLTGRVAASTAIRAVASANGANAISILVPCHRVIGSTGELVGYAGGLPAKRKLLELERQALGRLEPDLFSAQVDGL